MPGWTSPRRPRATNVEGLDRPSLAARPGELSHHAIVRGLRAGRVVEVDDAERAWRCSNGRRTPRTGALERLHVPRRGPDRRATAPSPARSWNGASREIVKATRPASSTGGRPSTKRSAMSRALARRRASMSSTSTPRVDRRSRRSAAHAAQRARGGGADGGVLTAQQLHGLGRPRQELGSRGTSQSVSSSSQRPAASSADANPVEQRRPRWRRPSKNGAAGARVARSAARRRARRNARRATPSSRHTTTTAREPMCFSSHTTSRDAVARGSTRTPPRDVRAASGSRWSPSATSWAGDRSATRIGREPAHHLERGHGVLLADRHRGAEAAWSMMRLPSTSSRSSRSSLRAARLVGLWPRSEAVSGRIGS